MHIVSLKPSHQLCIHFCFDKAKTKQLQSQTSEKQSRGLRFEVGEAPSSRPLVPLDIHSTRKSTWAILRVHAELRSEYCAVWGSTRSTCQVCNEMYCSHRASGTPCSLWMLTLKVHKLSIRAWSAAKRKLLPRGVTLVSFLHVFCTFQWSHSIHKQSKR